MKNNKFRCAICQAMKGSGKWVNLYFSKPRQVVPFMVCLRCGKDRKKVKVN